MCYFVARRVVVLAVLFAALVAGTILSAQRASSAMVTAATRFVDSLSADQRQRVVLDFASNERFRWHFIPDEMFARQGLPIGAMTGPQRTLAQDLLRAGLSQRGYLTYTEIMKLEAILRAIENGRLARDPEAYVFSVFGTPGAEGTWGWRVEGHHISLNFTVVNGAVASSPSFAGANPAEVRDGARKGLRVLALQEDSARTLLMALDESQRATAIFDARSPRDIVTENMPVAQPLAPVGLSASAMTPRQRELLLQVIDTYASLLADDIAAGRMASIRNAGIENIVFGWAGGTERGEPHYYRIQGPTFLIELDNTQGGGNHIHSVWRDFNGDFGRDLLREHIAASH